LSEIAFLDTQCDNIQITDQLSSLKII